MWNAIFNEQGTDYLAFTYPHDEVLRAVRKAYPRNNHIGHNLRPSGAGNAWIPIRADCQVLFTYWDIMKRKALYAKLRRIIHQ